MLLSALSADNLSVTRSQLHSPTVQTAAYKTVCFLPYLWLVRWLAGAPLGWLMIGSSPAQHLLPKGSQLAPPQTRGAISPPTPLFPSVCSCLFSHSDTYIFLPFCFPLTSFHHSISHFSLPFILPSVYDFLNVTVVSFLNAGSKGSMLWAINSSYHGKVGEVRGVGPTVQVSEDIYCSQK